MNTKKVVLVKDVMKTDFVGNLILAISHIISSGDIVSERTANAEMTTASLSAIIRPNNNDSKVIVKVSNKGILSSVWNKTVSPDWDRIRFKGTKNIETHKAILM